MRGLISAEMIVMKDIAIDTYPAYEDGTPNAVCITGHPDPRSESGSPRLMNIRYITAKSSEPMCIVYTFRVYNSIRKP